LLVISTSGVTQEVSKPMIVVIYSGFEDYRHRDVFDDYLKKAY